MNDRELQRFSVIQDVLHCNLSRQDASRILGISYRQLSRLIKSFVRFGAASFLLGTYHQDVRTLFVRRKFPVFN
nr:helix-turn-helix domain-containing protein [uncultured Vibrio sp.]